MPVKHNRALRVQFFGIKQVDLVLSPGEDGASHLGVITGKEEWIQALKLRLLEQKGDWIFDPDLGLPWIAHPRYKGPHILGSKPAMRAEMIKLFIMREILKDERVTRVEDLQVWWADERTRTLGISGWVFFDGDERGFPLNLTL